MPTILMMVLDFSCTESIQPVQLTSNTTVNSKTAKRVILRFIHSPSFLLGLLLFACQQQSQRQQNQQQKDRYPFFQKAVKCAKQL